MKKIFEFFKRQEDPTVEFYSVVPGLEDVCPPVLMKECIPNWFKNMPLDAVKRTKMSPSTAKKCPAFIDLFSMGYVLKLWCDLNISINKDKTWQVWTPEDTFKFDNHGDEQFLDYIPNRDYFNFSMVLKAICPWRVKTSPGYSIMQMPMFYDFNKTFFVLPGTIWTDIHHEINQQIVFYEYGDFFIPRGTPLAVYIPFKREKTIFKVSKFDTALQYSEAVAYQWWAGKFKNGYREHQVLLKKENNNDTK